MSPIKYEDNSFTFIHSSMYSFFITVQIIKELERLSSFLNNRKQFEDVCALLFINNIQLEHNVDVAKDLIQAI